MKTLTATLLLALLTFSAMRAPAQMTRSETFEKIQLLVTEGDKIREIDVRVTLTPEEMIIEPRGDNGPRMVMKYSEIRAADYSYTKNPRWKTGLGLGATALVFPPMLLIALPLAFTKHRRHWVTIRGEKDYAVLKVSKSIRKVFTPAFETYSNVRVEALGENK